MLTNKRSSWLMLSLQWVFSLLFLNSIPVVLEQLWHCFLHFLVYCVCPSLLLCLSLSCRLTPFRSMFHFRLHRFCRYSCTWYKIWSHFLCSGNCQILLSFLFCKTTVKALNFFWTLYNPASSAAYALAIPPVSHAWSYLCTMFSYCPRQHVNEVGCCHYMKDTITIYIHMLNLDAV